MDTNRNELNPHIPGAHSVLNMRDASQWKTKYGRELFGWAIVQIVRFSVCMSQGLIRSKYLSIIDSKSSPSSTVASTMPLCRRRSA